MLDYKLLEDIVSNIENWSCGELNKIKVLSEDEIKVVSAKVETGDCCDMDIINLCVTAMYYLRNHEIAETYGRKIVCTSDLWDRMAAARSVKILK